LGQLAVPQVSCSLRRNFAYPDVYTGLSVLIRAMSLKDHMPPCLSETICQPCISKTTVAWQNTCGVGWILHTVGSNTPSIANCWFMVFAFLSWHTRRRVSLVIGCTPHQGMYVCSTRKGFCMGCLPHFCVASLIIAVKYFAIVLVEL
jgi:hypothetical protein